MSEMQITTEELEDFKLKVNYVADKNVVKNKNKEALDSLRGMKVPGFRPGKATDLAIRVKYKDRIEQWVKSEMINLANEDIVFQTKILPIGKPKIELAKLAGSDFKLEAVYNKKPDFELAEYKGIEIPEPHIEKSLEDKVNEFLQTLREKHSDVRPYEENDFVQKGDKVTLEYELSNGDKEEGKLYEVGTNLFEEFDDGLYGMTAGENRKFDVLIDSKKVNCSVTLHMGLKSVICPLDDTLAAKCGVKTVDEVLNSVRSIAENQIKAERNEKIVEQIKLRLLESNKFDPPNWLTSQEAEGLARQQGLIYADLNDEAKEKIRSQASDNVKFTLIVDSIRKAEAEVELSDQEALEGIKQNLLQRGVKDLQGFLTKAQKDGSLFGFVERMKNDYVIQFLVDKAVVVK
jgi:trigger factor